MSEEKEEVKQEDNFAERVLIERDELANKMILLANALNEETIPKHARPINERQYRAMEAYHDILNIKLGMLVSRKPEETQKSK